MSTNYSTKQLYDMLETLDVYDTLNKLAHDRALAESKTKK